jgi:asparagine synthase (glutamine-hydrolysing)
MCGILGKFTFDSHNHESPPVFEGALNYLSHRGPDNSENWHYSIPDICRISLGHTRLSIIDLSSSGNQPMINPETGTVIVYNGEIYNYKEIRERLESKKTRFQSECDTEVVLAAYEDCKRSFTKEFIGMFALALFDPMEKKVVLARDRLGIKPLYYYWDGQNFAFSSEITALSALPTLDLEVSQDAISQLLMYGYIPYPLSIFKKVNKLTPGNILVLDLKDRKFEKYRYWNVLSFYSDEVQLSNENEAMDAVRYELEHAVRRRLISDVPIGAFLSGGIDSSLIVALMQEVSNSTVRTFTVGFTEDQWNEAPYAKRIANHIGTKHEEIYISENEMLDLVPIVADYYDEPFADSSSIPMLALSRMTREHVKVALSGDGGDELFWGYNRYADTSFVQFDKYRFFPYWLRVCISRAMRMMKFRRFQEWGHLLSFRDIVDFYAGSGLTGLKMYPQLHIRPAKNNRLIEINRDVISQLHGNSLQTILSAMDLHSYLPDDILAKVDRASMSVGLEVRVPMLDHNFVKLAIQLPEIVKQGKEGLKHILKKLLLQYIPRELWDRPKKGFSVPMSNWLCTSLKDFAYEELLSVNSELHNWLEKKELLKILDDHIGGKRNNNYLIWSCIQLSGWSRKVKNVRLKQKNEF